MLKSFTLRFDRSAYFDRAHVRGLGFLVGDAGVFGGYENTTKKGQIYKDGSSTLNYSAKFEYRNRTATSVEVRVV